MPQKALYSSAINYVFPAFILPVCTWYFIKADSLYEQNYLLIFFFSLFILYRFFFNIGREPFKKSLPVKAALTGITLLSVLLLWNKLYLYYIKQYGYTSDIFRKPMQTLHAPLYGLYQQPLYPFDLITIAAAGISIFIIVYILPKTRFQYEIPVIAIIHVFLITGFCFSDGQNRWSMDTVHFNTYKEGIRYFKNIPDLLAFYVPTMGQMGEHNNHYPPGNLLLLWMEKNYAWPGLILIINIVLSVITLFITGKIAKRLLFNGHQLTLVLLLYVISANVLIFTTIDFSPVPMLLFTLGILFFLEYTQTNNNKALILLALQLIIFAFFSFTVSLFLVFMLVFSILLIYRKQISFTKICTGGFFIFIIFTSAYVLIYLFTGFNLYLCFIQAVRLTHELMTTSGFDNFIRYLVRSTGNLTGFLMATGITGMVFLSGLLNVKNRNRNPDLHETNNSTRSESTNSMAQSFRQAFTICLLIFSFSGLFFLETERIWLCLVPLMALASSSCPDEISIGQRNVIVISGIFTACVLELFWCQI